MALLRSLACPLRSAPAASVIVTFDSMKLSGRRLFHAGLTTPYHFLDFCPASRTMARGTSCARDATLSPTVDLLWPYIHLTAALGELGRYEEALGVFERFWRVSAEQAVP